MTERGTAAKLLSDSTMAGALSCGPHAILGTTGVPEDARQLLLEYGAYSAWMS